jgi:hypothetical protein
MGWIKVGHFLELGFFTVFMCLSLLWTYKITLLRSEISTSTHQNLKTGPLSTSGSSSSDIKKSKTPSILP